MAKQIPKLWIDIDTVLVKLRSGRVGLDCADWDETDFSCDGLNCGECVLSKAPVETYAKFFAGTLAEKDL